MVRATVLLMLWLVCLAGSGLAQTVNPYEEADAAYARGDFPNALKIFRALAADGDAVAQFNLGVMLDFGQGTAADQVQAAGWYRKAAAQGHGAAQFNLGGLYLEGLGVPKDPVRAYMWFTVSAAAGVQGAAKNRTSVATLLSAADVTRAQQLARTCQQSGFQNCD
jgi:TPR repeat protein